MCSTCTDFAILFHERSEWPRVGVARATEGGFRVLDQRARRVSVKWLGQIRSTSSHVGWLTELEYADDLKFIIILDSIISD